GVPPEQVIGSALETQYIYNKAGQGVLMRPPKQMPLLLNNNFSGKAEDIYLFIGRHPKAAFGNSTGDREMLEYTQAGGADDAGASRRRAARICLRPSSGIVRYQGRHLHPGPVR